MGFTAHLKTFPGSVGRLQSRSPPEQLPRMVVYRVVYLGAGSK